MVIQFSRLNKIMLFLLLLIPAEVVVAEQASLTGAEADLNDVDKKRAAESTPLTQEKGLITLDYEVIPVPGIQSLDLIGVHYLHQLNGWLYLGVGVHAPLVQGNYGGFMAFDTTIHAQRKIFGDLFVDAGLSLGGGGGGSTVKQSRQLSGTGGFVKSYAGVGYDFNGFSAGVNYSHFRFLNSLINHSQVNLFVQKPVSYMIGSYADSGSTIESDWGAAESGEKILTFELNNIFQIKPQGTSRKTINAFSLQFSHFLTENYYLLFAADIGYSGIPLYNQVLGGLGYRLPVSSRVNIYGQVGVGSGGYAPAEIDTGPGLLVYPKLSLEYMLNSELGLSLSGGYLFAPKGSSKNFTLGAAMNYHISGGENHPQRFSSVEAREFRGFRFNLFQQTEFDVQVGNNMHNNINMLSIQFDYILNDYCYIPVQANVAYNEFLGYPGYGQILTGLGIQSDFSASDSLQGFMQILAGADVHGMVLKPTIGVNLTLSDHLALYAQLGKTVSLHKLNIYPKSLRLSSYSAGLGLTYRFSLANSIRN